MAEYDNELTGVLFKNEKQRTDKDPGYTGSAEIEGVEYWLSAWVNDGKKGKYFKLKFKPKDDSKKPAGKKKPENRDAEPEDDNIPFAWLLPFAIAAAAASLPYII